MVFVTHLIFIKEGQEEVFNEFEKIAIPLMAKHKGKMLLRLRPPQSAVIEQSMETPYEVHLGEFESESDFKAFLHDEERKQFLHMKDQAIASSILVTGRRS